MRRLSLFVALAGLFASPAFAQSTYPTAQGGRVAGVVPLQCDANGANCVPAGTAGAPAAGAQQVQGNVPTATTDSGNPVKIGGVAETLAVVTAGQRVDAAFTRGGALFVAADYSGGAGSDGVGAVYLPYRSQGALGGGFNLPLMSAGYVYNGATWDRARGDTSGAYVVDVPSAAANAGSTNVATAAVAGSLTAKASGGNLYGLNVTAGASAGYVMVFNATGAPADGAVTPARCIPLAANTGIDLNFRGQPVYFNTGITVVFSTTGCFSKTASATAFIAADVK